MRSGEVLQFFLIIWDFFLVLLGPGVGGWAGLKTHCGGVHAPVEGRHASTNPMGIEIFSLAMGWIRARVGLLVHGLRWCRTARV